MWSRKRIRSLLKLLGIAVFSVLPGCEPLHTAGELGTTCQPEQFGEAFSAYRAASSNHTLWLQAQCNMGVPVSETEAYALQENFVASHARLSDRIGFKVALGSRGAQQLLGASEPVVGVLFDSTLLSSGSTLTMDAARGVAVEADLLVTVASSEINKAQSIEQVAKSVESIHAYIEVPDLVLPLQNDMATRFIASNAGAFRGIVGDVLRPSEGEQLLDALATMQVELRDAKGTVLSRSSGNSLMGHPYNAVLFLVSKLRQRGEELSAGDVISLGAYSKPIPIKSLSSEAAQKISVHYLGLIDQKRSKPLSAHVFF